LGILDVMRPLIAGLLLVAAVARAAPDAAPPPSPRPGVIPRAELVRVLDAGPGAFLAHVDTQPRFVAGRFHGWRVNAFFPGDPRFSDGPLKPGDVVVRVSGRILERPEQLMEVWQALRGGKELVVEVERNGAARTLRWTIAD
jgi:S1-C subfamily serine protease